MSVVMRSTSGSRSDVKSSRMTGVMTPRITAYSAIVCPASRRIACRAVTATPPANVSGGRRRPVRVMVISSSTAGLRPSPRRVIPSGGPAKARWYRWRPQADVAQLVEHWLPKPRVAGSSPVVRFPRKPARVAGIPPPHYRGQPPSDAISTPERSALTFRRARIAAAESWARWP